MLKIPTAGSGNVNSTYTSELQNDFNIKMGSAQKKEVVYREEDAVAFIDKRIKQLELEIEKGCSLLEKAGDNFKLQDSIRAGIDANSNTKAIFESIKNNLNLFPPQNDLTSLSKQIKFLEGLKKEKIEKPLKYQYTHAKNSEIIDNLEKEKLIVENIIITLTNLSKNVTTSRFVS